MPFQFSFNSFAIRTTRSVHEDTDYFGMGFFVNGVSHGTLVQRAGNVNNGTYNVQDMDFLLDSFLTTDQLVINYLIINHGGGKAQDVLTDCQNALNQPVIKTFNALDAAPFVKLGRSLPNCLASTLHDINPLWDGVKSQFNGLSSDRCDGPVAIDRISFKGESLTGIESASPISIIFEGIPSAVGCGSNSYYSVQWGITAV